MRYITINGTIAPAQAVQYDNNIFLQVKSYIRDNFNIKEIC